MASGFPGRDYYGGNVGYPMYNQRAEGVGGLLKRSLTEMERQQQLRHALFLRSVKQKTHQATPISPLSPLDLTPSASIISPEILSFSGSAAASSVSSTQSPGYPSFRRAEPSPGFAFPNVVPAAPEPEPEKKATAMRDQLQELERRLLLDDEDEGQASASGSAVTTNNEWSETMQQLLSPAQNPLSPSPTSSSSSTASSSTSVSASSRQLLVDTATAISDGNLETATTNLALLKQGANPRGDPDQRLTAVMVSALMSRLNPPAQGSHHTIAELCSVEHLAGMALLQEISPVFKLGLVAANLAILDAARDQPRIHILDLDVGQGAQYAALIHALAEQHRHRATRPPTLKITAITDPSIPFHAINQSNISTTSNLRLVGERLRKLAELAGICLQFHIVSLKASDLDRSSLGCEPGEALAVNFAFLLSRVADESVTPANPRDELLRRVKSLCPLVVTLIEQDINANTASFAPRFAETCAHYGALLESLDATVARDSAERIRLEACVARKAANSVAREGADRVERCEVFGKWRARMAMAGFSPIPVGPAVSDPVRARLNSLRTNPGFTLKEEAGGLCFGWLGRVLTFASAWR